MGEDADYFDGGCSFNMSSKKKSKIKKRFSDEQIKSLETMFESETKLEPRKKLQLAKELGLQPRQVAIWFQNKRARWKSKQLEREYSVLRANYNSLASQFEALKKEKQSLVVQLKKLHEMMGTTGEEGSQCGRQDQLAGNSSTSTTTTYDNVNISSEVEEVKPSLSWVGSDLGGGGNVLSSDDDIDSSIKAEYFGMEDGAAELLNMEMVEPAAAGDGSLTSSENWEGLDSNGLLDQSTSNSSYQWWDFWS